MWMTVACGPLCCDCSKLHQEQAQTARVGELARLSQKELESQLVGKMDVHSLKTSPHVTLRPTYAWYIFFCFLIIQKLWRSATLPDDWGGQGGQKNGGLIFFGQERTPSSTVPKQDTWKHSIGGKVDLFRFAWKLQYWNDFKKTYVLHFAFQIDLYNFIIVVLLHCNGNCNILTVKHPNQRFARKRKLEGTPIGMI